MNRARGKRVVVGPESLIADVHISQASVDVVAPLVEGTSEIGLYEVGFLRSAL